jgi:hypothetical protein
MGTAKSAVKALRGRKYDAFRDKLSQASGRGSDERRNRMSRLGIATVALAAIAGTGSPSAAGSWSLGVGVEYGPPVYYGPPSVYYGPPPVFYEPPIYYEPAPPPVVLQMVTADDVLDALEGAGYRELGPMAQRGALYSLAAVNPRGDVVALEISVYNGAIERELILESPRYAAPQVVQPAPNLPPPSTIMQPAPPPVDAERDPLVVY